MRSIGQAFQEGCLKEKITMHSVGLGSQSKMSMIFSAPSRGGRMAFSEVNIFPWTLDIPYSFGVQIIIDFSFYVQACSS